MELRHLRYFLCVAEELHFGRAAKRLHMAQPPLSRQIQALEQEVGFALFDRSRRQVVLTPAGRAFVAHARRVFEALDVGVDEARRAARGEVGRVAVGYMTSLAYCGLSEVVQSFRSRLPDVELSLREMVPQDQAAALRDERIDVGFLRGPLGDPSLSAETVRRERLLVALPGDHPLAARRRVPLAALAQEPFVAVLRQRSPAFFDRIVSICRDAGFSPRITQESPHADVLSLVSAGFGVSIVPDPIRSLARADVELRPIVGNPTIDLLMAWRARDASPALAELLALVRKQGVKRHDVREDAPPRGGKRSPGRPAARP